MADLTRLTTYDNEKNNRVRWFLGAKIGEVDKDPHLQARSPCVENRSNSPPAVFDGLPGYEQTVMITEIVMKSVRVIMIIVGFGDRQKPCFGRPSRISF
jgi:hypothetical protein